MGNPSLYPELIENGIVMDITGDSAIEELGLSAADLGDCSFQGKVYAYPLDYKTWGVFYNTKVFEELGLEIPTTATELEEVSKAIEAAGYDVWADWYSDGASVDIQTILGRSCACKAIAENNSIPVSLIFFINSYF